MHNDKIFKISTPLGFIFATINGPDSFFLHTNQGSDCGLTYRNEKYEVRAWGAINPETKQFDLRTYGPDGNTVVFSQSAQNSWYKLKSLNITSKWNGKKFVDASETATQKFYDNILESVNLFIKNNEKEIRAAWRERDKADFKEKIFALVVKHNDLKIQLAQNDTEIFLLETKFEKKFGEKYSHE